VRRLPGLRQTASWQAAYNTACLYAALISERRASATTATTATTVTTVTSVTSAAWETSPSAQERDWEDRVVLSLERVAANPHAEMRRPFDVIASDPDFGAFRAAPTEFHAFAQFLSDQRRKDYPTQTAPDPEPALGAERPI